MKIVTWNCNGALRRKFQTLSELEADIYIIQECENPANIEHSDYQKWAENHLWIGNSKNKGLGIFASSRLEIKLLDWTNSYLDHSVKHFLPCSVNGDFDLIGVWTHRNNSPNFGYIGQFWKYLQLHKLKFKKTVIAGDFNSNVIWDEWDRWWNHSNVVSELNEIGIKSLYHSFSGELQGKESRPTLFHQRNLNKSYHIDYIFGSSEFAENLKKIEIGSLEKWFPLSDHLPVISEFDI